MSARQAQKGIRSHAEQNAILAELFRPVAEQMREGKTLHQIVVDRGFELRSLTNIRGSKQWKVFDDSGEPLPFCKESTQTTERLIAWLDEPSKRLFGPPPTFPEVDGASCGNKS